MISAATSQGISELRSEICKALDRGLYTLRINLPYAHANLLDLLHRGARVLSLEYQPEHVTVCTVCNEKFYGRVRKFVVEGEES